MSSDDHGMKADMARKLARFTGPELEQLLALQERILCQQQHEKPANLVRDAIVMTEAEIERRGFTRFN